jgi:hypothetical protein
MDNAIRSLEICLRRALEATGEDFLRWENDLGPSFEEDGYDDEFTLPDVGIRDMPLEEKLAIRRAAHQIAAHDYGVGYDF